MDPNNDQTQPGSNDAKDVSMQMYSRRAEPVAPILPKPANPSADAARRQAEHVYQHNPPNQLQNQTTKNPLDLPKTSPPPGATNAWRESVFSERGEPVGSSKEEKQIMGGSGKSGAVGILGKSSVYHRTHQPTFDWQQYHTAWQKYYQQYYHRYYSQQILAQRAQQIAPQQAIAVDDASPEPVSRFRQLHDDLLTKVGERSKKFRRSNHFVPILSAITVGLIFLFLQYNRVLVAQIEAYVSPGSTVNVSDTMAIDPATAASIGNDPKLIIPKINVSVPVTYDVNTVNDKVVQDALDRGVVHYKLPGASSLPGQAGNAVILGHSSNDVFDSGGYKFAFVLINRLEPGDLFYANYQGKRYVYKVTDKKIIKPTDWRILQQSNGGPTMILVTCTPAGTSQNRLLVYGEQISPDPTAATTAPTNKEDANPATIPGNSPTFFERLWDIFF